MKKVIAIALVLCSLFVITSHSETERFYSLSEIQEYLRYTTPIKVIRDYPEAQLTGKIIGCVDSLYYLLQCDDDDAYYSLFLANGEKCCLIRYDLYKFPWGIVPEIGDTVTIIGNINGGYSSVFLPLIENAYVVTEE